MKIAAITPTRGNEREKLLKWCRHRVAQMGYDHHYVIDYPPIDDGIDLYQRIAVGVNRAIQHGFEYVSIIEDDDYYPQNYIDYVRKMLKTADVVGFNTTTYYHIFTQRYQVMKHFGRSSLFTTSFKSNVFGHFPINPPGYFDIALWKKVINTPNIQPTIFGGEVALGIKHGIGLCGGNGHTMKMRQIDHEYRYLKNRVDSEALNFYMELITNHK